MFEINITEMFQVLPFNLNQIFVHGKKPMGSALDIGGHFTQVGEKGVSAPDKGHASAVLTCEIMISMISFNLFCQL